MASLSTCFTITPNYKSKHFLYSVKNNYIFHNHKHFLKLGKQNNNRSYYVSEIRAGFDAPPVTGIRPGKIIESDKLPADVRKRTMEAVDSYGKRVTVGDVANKAGIKLTEAQKALQALAADTDGFLEVSDEGDIFYVFPKDYRSKLEAKSFRIKAEPVLEKATSGAEYFADKDTCQTRTIYTFYSLQSRIMNNISIMWDPAKSEILERHGMREKKN